MHIRKYLRGQFRALALDVPELGGRVKLARGIPRSAEKGPVCAVSILEDRPENEAMGGGEIRAVTIGLGIAVKGEGAEDTLDDISLALEAAVVAWGVQEVNAERLYRVELERTGFDQGGGSDEVVGMEMIYSAWAYLTEDAPVISNP